MIFLTKQAYKLSCPNMPAPFLHKNFPAGFEKDSGRDCRDESKAPQPWDILCPLGHILLDGIVLVPVLPDVYAVNGLGAHRSVTSSTSGVGLRLDIDLIVCSPAFVRADEFSYFFSYLDGLLHLLPRRPASAAIVLLGGIVARHDRSK